MPIVPGKPGTLRVRGVIRAQCRAARSKIQSILQYNTKLANRVPPVTFLTPQEAIDFANVSLELQTLLAARNV